MRVSVKAIIVRDGKLLTLQCCDDDNIPFYILPGGGQEHGESLHDTLIRECREEIGVEVVPGPLLYVRDHMQMHYSQPDKSQQQVEIMFAATIADDARPTGGTAPDVYQQDIVWLPVKQLEDYLFFPLALREVMAQYDLSDQAELPAHALYIGAVE